MKANLSCEECQRELVALIDGALTPSVARVVEGHAASCASCGRALLDFRARRSGSAGWSSTRCRPRSRAACFASSASRVGS